ncbi:MAG: hypothetical protein P4M04_07250 [Acidobacteriota bacterium]|nr:hypothetical protein [Acidobacteriota bacterium]
MTTSSPRDGEISAAERAAIHLLNLLDSPAKFQNKETITRWTNLLAGLMGETKLVDTELIEYITWAVKDNYDDQQNRSSAEWLPAASDPCKTLIKHSSGGNPYLLQRWKAKQGKAKAAAKTKADTGEIQETDEERLRREAFAKQREEDKRINWQ